MARLEARPDLRSDVHVDHVALWARDLERMRAFYVSALGGTSGALYENPRSGFRSYFIGFGGGARLELMSRPDGQVRDGGEGDRFGFAHIALRLESRAAVDALAAGLEASGVPLLGRPRVTGDGYYEAVVADPEGNRIELVG